MANLNNQVANAQGVVAFDNAEPIFNPSVFTVDWNQQFIVDPNVATESNGFFTISNTGVYEINVNLLADISGFDPGDLTRLELVRPDGSIIEIIDLHQAVQNNPYVLLQGSVVKRFNADEVFAVQVRNLNVRGIELIPFPLYNEFSLQRIQ